MPLFLFSQTAISGNVSGAWAVAGSPYILSDNVIVVDSLSIEPGVVVKFQAGGLSIKVGANAKLKAVGTETNPIEFEPFLGTNSGSYQGIYLENSGNDDIFKHCVIRYGINGIKAYDSSPMIEKCEIFRNSENGILLDYNHTPQEPSIVSYCNIYENGTSGILFGGYDRYGAISVTARIDHCTIFNNEQNGIIIWSGTYWSWGSAYAQAQISNCVVVGNSTGIRAYAYRGYADAKILNTIIAYNSDHAIINQDGAARIDANDIIHNAFWMNSPENFSTIAGVGFGEPGNFFNNNGDTCDVNFNIYSDPFFIDPSNHNFCVNVSKSKCVDAGTSIIFDSIVLDSDGSLPDIGVCYETISNINEAKPDFGEKFNLEQNHPNPFTSFTTISYHLQNPSLVELAVYNPMSQKVKTLINQKQQSGEHKIQWDGKNEQGIPAPAGVYYYCLRMGQYVQGKKMLLLR